jgi:phosphoribosylformylglycinamidine (FGAM) synthase-like enzyme
MDAKKPGHGLVVVGERTHEELGGSTYASLFDAGEHGRALPRVNLETAPAAARFVAAAIRAGLVAAVHDVSDGGVACAAAEMLIAAQRHAGPTAPRGGLGAAIRTPALHRDPVAACFGESPTRWVVEVDLERVPELIALRDEHAPHAEVTPIGVLNDSGELAIDGEAVAVDDLAKAWLGTLDW